MAIVGTGSVNLSPTGDPGVSKGVFTTGASAPKSTGTPGMKVLGAQAVRATGSGPYDSAYRQNLATYAGAGLARNAAAGSGGYLGLNPTGTIGGTPSGAGNAPVSGAPTSLSTQALGSQGFAANTTAPTQVSTTPKYGKQVNPYQDWLGKYWMSGSLLRGY